MLYYVTRDIIAIHVFLEQIPLKVLTDLSYRALKSNIPIMMTGKKINVFKEAKMWVKRKDIHQA